MSRNIYTEYPYLKKITPLLLPVGTYALGNMRGVSKLTDEQLFTSAKTHNLYKSCTPLHTGRWEATYSCHRKACRLRLKEKNERTISSLVRKSWQANWQVTNKDACAWLYLSDQCAPNMLVLPGGLLSLGDSQRHPHPQADSHTQPLQPPSCLLSSFKAPLILPT